MSISLPASTLEDAGFDKQVTDTARLNLMQHATELLPWLKDAPVVAHLVPVCAPDRLTVGRLVSRHPEIGNLYII